MKRKSKHILQNGFDAFLPALFSFKTSETPEQQERRTERMRMALGNRRGLPELTTAAPPRHTLTL